jgi:CRISPR-associated protein Cmr6
MIIPLPESVRKFAKEKNTHPGLLLDKYAQSWSDALTPSKLSAEVQLPTIQEVVRLSQAPPDGIDFSQVIEQRKLTLAACHARFLNAQLTGPLTLHLSRASALENAGICLHRTYGFTYLPGSGVKGLTRAWAETVWLPAQSNGKQAYQSIEDVFGWAPNPNRRDLLQRELIDRRFRTFEPLRDSNDKPIEQTEHSGRVVFHDAWPNQWPRLMIDILNSHHGKYYSGKPDNQPPPGDWEEPIPVYFLAVPAGVEFSFAVSARRTEDAETANLATQWLAAALTDQGAGAKTNAGYGAFRVTMPAATDKVDLPAIQDKNKSDNRHRKTNLTLRLATPAFLAGAEAENPQSCELRPATLRGQLRWWWRTLHAAHLSPVDLKRLEAVIWGDTEQGGAARITILPNDGGQAPKVKAFDRQGIISANRLPPSGKKVTQGLIYASYGMDERRGGVQVRRSYVEPDAVWSVTIQCRAAKYFEPKKSNQSNTKAPKVIAELNAQEIEAEVLAAFELLCRFGGVGSKSRKGFGCFSFPSEVEQAEWSPQRRRELLHRAALIRTKCKFKPGKTESPSLDSMIEVDPVVTPWTNYWMAIDRTAHAAQRFAQDNKHDLSKQALGLPRNIRPPYKGKFKSPPDVKSRHASPVHYHLETNEKGQYIARIVAFPAHRLPDFETSKQFLTDATSKVQEFLEQEVKDHGSTGELKAKGSRSSTGQPPAPVATAKVVKPGTWVAAVLSSEKTKKGGWMAKYGSQTGPIQNTGDVPPDCQPNQEVELIVQIANPRQIAFRWPTPGSRKP